jgi:hypothetical protein
VATLLATFTVRVWLAGLLVLTVKLVGERVIPGTGLLVLASTRERFTVPVKPFWGVRVRVVLPLAPCCTVRLVGEREMVKLGAGLLQAASKRASRTRRPSQDGPIRVRSYALE